MGAVVEKWVPETIWDVVIGGPRAQAMEETGAGLPLRVEPELWQGAERPWTDLPSHQSEQLADLLHGATKGGSLSLSAFAASTSAGMDALVQIGGRPVVLRRHSGAGEVWLVSTPYPFTNLGLFAGETGAFAAAIVSAASESGRRAVLFDEYAHGYWTRRGKMHWLTSTELRFALMGPLLVTLVLGWRGAIRRGPPRQQRLMPRRAKEEYVVSLADLAVRAGRHHLAAAWLCDAHRHRLQQRQGGSGDTTGSGSTELLELARLEHQCVETVPFGPAELAALAARLRNLAAPTSPAGAASGSNGV
ncbi:MAG: hypothetical protein HYV63_17795 [Candidatus Schekmanbacteria bacterium]|nr:hypothetical protein [Candidatus Schekmanbacteria bacterium]